MNCVENNQLTQSPCNCTNTRQQKFLTKDSLKISFSLNDEFNQSEISDLLMFKTIITSVTASSS